ncbi:DUF1751-domain-containing protein [Ceraceosorus guamensis]|uniref:DUF1751-domain-containing protein n=1 Tax=Ceraceosorus guamensis TaxID=1522189 RepID=A0A316W717_9BASI|nr:DUF1751-domain-containing protein [Ceraceosorus guamensis]PWN45710.1 DUF1751-domain-containing protein [Ceraceosorus guamensis]
MAVFDAASVLQSLPIATRSLSIALVSLSLLLFVLRITLSPADARLHILSWSHKDSATLFPALVLVPGTSWVYPWTLITSSICETTVAEFLISIVSLPLAGRYLERLWGPIELVKFVGVVLVGSNVIAWFLAVLAYLVFRGERGMYGTQYHGLMALQTGFLVALAQLIPEHQIQLFHGRVRIRVRDLPMAYVTLSNVLCLVGELSPFILIQFGWLISWAYLRFFKAGEGGIRGDRSETFSFVSWFPPFLHKPVGALSNLLYPLFVKLGIVQPWSYSALGDVELGVGRELPGRSNSGAEAERRRAMALKALDSRAVPRPGSSGGANASGSSKGPGDAAGAPAASSTASAADEKKALAAAQAVGSSGSTSVPSVVVSRAKEDEHDAGDIGARKDDDDDDDDDWN